MIQIIAQIIYLKLEQFYEKMSIVKVYKNKLNFKHQHKINMKIATYNNLIPNTTLMHRLYEIKQ